MLNSYSGEKQKVRLYTIDGNYMDGLIAHIDSNYRFIEFKGNKRDLEVEYVIPIKSILKVLALTKEYEERFGSKATNKPDHLY